MLLTLFGIMIQIDGWLNHQPLDFEMTSMGDCLEEHKNNNDDDDGDDHDDDHDGFYCFEQQYWQDHIRMCVYTYTWICWTRMFIYM